VEYRNVIFDPTGYDGPCVPYTLSSPAETVEVSGKGLGKLTLTLKTKSCKDKNRTPLKPDYVTVTVANAYLDKVTFQQNGKTSAATDNAFDMRKDGSYILEFSNVEPGSQIIISSAANKGKSGFGASAPDLKLWVRCKPPCGDQD